MNGETKAKRRAGGFSLMELMAVVLIMGILSTVVGVVVAPKIFKSKLQATKTGMKTIQTELASYQAEHNSYPATLSVLPLTQQPPKDGWRQLYSYAATPDGLYKYSLFSAGPDQEHGTEDDINVWTMDEPTN